MQAAMAVRQSASHDRMRDTYHVPRSQSAGGMHPRSQRSEPSMENLAPMLMPSGLNSMLKNTTETGDIGIFSIKPTRLPRHNGSSTLSSLPKAAYHDLAAQSPDFSLFRAPPRRDDRRRLPSYNRDITSEIASLYETNSMKSSASSKVFDEQEQRSFSMTQTSMNASRLANHRSYASLRSQGDMSVGQRPRSPFAYPTRLRRPGFRPCSPALTDGGVIDYSRRAEIGRESSVVSPVSPNASESQRRAPQPLSIRTDVNRSKPSHANTVPPSPRPKGLPVSSSSGGRISPGPSNYMPQSPLQRELQVARSPTMGRNSSAPPSLNQAASPAAPSPSRSVSSNNAAVPSRMRSRASSSATTDKVPASPLYYDYTESFYPDDEVAASQAEEYYATPPAPPFMVERTIHEDRELSSDWSYLAMADLRGRGFLASEGLNFTPEEAIDGSVAQPLDLSYPGAARTSPLRRVQVQSGYTSDGGLAEHSMVARVHGPDEIFSSDSSIRQRAGWNESHYGSAQATPLEERNDPNEDISFVEPGFSYSPERPSEPVFGQNTVESARGSVYEDARSFVSARSERLPHLANCSEAANKATGGTAELAQKQNSLSPSASVPVFTTTVPSDDGEFSPQTVGLALSTAEVSESANIEVDEEDVCPSPNGEFAYQQRRIAQTDFPLTRRESYQSGGLFHVDPRFKLNKYKSDSDLSAAKYGIREHNRYTIDGARGAHNMMHTAPRNPREFGMSPASEIVSPIPISPARELRVKNSIPQFMKTLPPLPLRQPVTERISLTDSRLSTSRRPPPLKLDPSTLAPISQSLSVVHNPITPTLPTPNSAKDGMQKQFANSSQPFLSRWRLKARSPAVLPKPSPPASRPWNLEDSYPWNSEVQPGEPLAAIVHKKSGLFAPKLKLKMMKSSESLALGTVRVKRGAAQGIKDVPTLGPPKDLFSSPSSGLTNMFRQVSRHLQESGDGFNSANAIPPHPEVLLAQQEGKANWSHKVTKSASKSTMTQKEKTSFSLTRSGQPSKSENSGTMPKLVKTVSRELRVATNIALRSATDNSTLHHEGSQHELHDSIRKKLRARLPMSHSRAQSRKSEDMISRPKTAASSAPLIMAGLDGANDYVPPPAPVGRSRRLKKKVSSWFKGAKATVLGCVRHKQATEASVDLTVPTTAV